MAELGATLGVSTFVIVSVVGVAWFAGRVDGRLVGVERAVEWLHVDVGRLRNDIGCARSDVEAILLRLPEEAA